FSQSDLTQVFKKVSINDSIIDLMNRPAERTKQWYEYEPMFVTNAQVIAGVKFWKENEAALTKAQQTYGVPPEIIVAIIGVETRYGSNKGSFPVIEALSTLSFDYPKRSEFFRNELKEYLLLAREEGVDPTTLLGSYAGAMGTPQFMPSSYRKYAVDFTGNKKRDIWNTNADAIGSVANYFKSHGWQTGEPVVYAAQVIGQDYQSLTKNVLDPNITIAELAKKGVTPREKIQLPSDERVTFIELQEKSGPAYWIGCHNFYVIMRYNPRVMYAMAVYELSTQIKQLKG
ncbi:MAG TPA: lytic murein transglycosylase B, partial [Gammaproteobacteria bacterium]|nr:lytic murein transglycosylase B [Gammaproteobacteria bacterium]